MKASIDGRDQLEDTDGPHCGANLLWLEAQRRLRGSRARRHPDNSGRQAVASTCGCHGAPAGCGRPRHELAGASDDRRRDMRPNGRRAGAAMSVVHLADPDIFSQHGLVGFLGGCPEDCFWCGMPLADPVVFWNGRGRDTLWLHHRCARDLAFQLLYDVRRAEAVARGQRLDAGVSLPRPLQRTVDAVRQSSPAEFEDHNNTWRLTTLQQPTPHRGSPLSCAGSGGALWRRR